MPKFKISAAFIIFMSALYFFDNDGLLSAMVPAVAAHELGHIIALRVMRAKVTCLSFQLSGIEMDYSGYLSWAGETLSSAAGPVAGFIYAYLASLSGRLLESEFLLCSSGVSIILTIFNLLPVLPLDGGRILEQITLRAGGENYAQSVMRRMGVMVSALTVVAGAFFACRSNGTALLASGLWLSLYAFKGTCKKAAAVIK